MEVDQARILEESFKIHLIYKESLVHNNSIDIPSLKKDIEKKFPYISSKLPSIVSLALGEGYDYNRLKFMLDTSSKVASNEMTERDASIKVGQVLVDDIVKPGLKKNNETAK